jgi:ketosteroid isomerase-like protein
VSAWPPPADVLAIDQLCATFAHALDHHDYARLRDVLAADVHYVGANGEFTDAAAVIASFQARTGSRTTRHGLSTRVLTTAGPDTVIGQATWHTFAANGAGADAAGPGGVPLYQVADFADVYRRDGAGRWWIAERIITAVFRDAALAPGR